jgi:hypothetical protein
MKTGVGTGRERVVVETEGEKLPHLAGPPASARDNATRRGIVF